jgi:hypothetical protein
MPAVVIARADDEIADLIDRVRSSADPDVGLVVPGSSRALQTPLNVRLLAQFSNQSNRRTSIVSEDPRIQQLARASGLQVYGSVQAFERGIELAGPRASGSALGRGVAAGAGGMAVAAVLDPPLAPPPPPPPLNPLAQAPATARLEPRRIITQLPPARPKRGWDRRRFLYAAGAGVAIIGIVLFMTLAPSAKITITIAATPLSVNSTIQGATDPTAATKPDHVLTGVVTSQAQAGFPATPTGTTTLPAVAAKVTLIFSTDATSDISFTLDPNQPTQTAVQTADQTMTFVPARKTVICIGPNNPPAPNSDCGTHPFNAAAPYVDVTAGASGNVSTGSLNFWSGDPCPGVNCRPTPFTHISVVNDTGGSGGADSKQVPAASATDVANWTAQVTTVEAGLAAQIQTDLQARAAGKTFAKDPAGNGETVSYTTVPADLPAANAPFTAGTITVKATAEAAIYDPVAVRNDVIADLDKLVRPGDVLAKGSLTTPPCTVTQANINGTVILACSATAFSQPTVNLNKLKAQLTGRNPGNAQKIVESNVAKVQGVNVSEWPFKLFYLPLRASNIEIIEDFVAISTKAP